MRFILLIILVVVLDQLSKLWVVGNFALYESVPVIPGFFSLTYLTNTGAAFGILAGHSTWWRQAFFIAIALAALVVITVMYRRLRNESVWYEVALAFIAGGAIGNVIDRVRLGSVVDFLDVYIGTRHWPAFNIADSAITVGVAVFLVKNIFFDEKPGNKSKQD
ncbi:MAG TPA: signal peptidase II [Desulfobacteraceae bacterium]|nr:signal peptidase II [Desulfobacteraceae bacterium]